MSINVDGIPLKLNKDRLDEFPATTASNNELYKFKRENKNYVMKELRLDSKYFPKLGNQPEIVAKWMNKAFAIISRYFCDDNTSIPKTYYFVANNRYGQPTVITLQEEVFGPTLRKEDRKLEKTSESVLNSFHRKWNLALLDPEWQEFPSDMRGFLQEMDINLDHIIYDRGKYNLVDW